MKTIEKECVTFWVRIYMAGDYNTANQVCREFVMHGGCVNIYGTNYVYTMGEEVGFCVELINYPRFPKSAEDIITDASTLANLLLDRLFQGSYTMVSPHKTWFVSRRKVDME